MVTVVSVGVNEKVPFRLFHMPCCDHPLCWVGPRLPKHCPECGTHILLALRTGEHTRIIDDDAWIRYKR
jgi:hypothetical protein